MDYKLNIRDWKGIDFPTILQYAKLAENYPHFALNCLGEKNHNQPSVNVYNQIPVEGIVGEWKLPFNETAYRSELTILVLGRILLPQGYISETEIDELFTHYKNLNPEIANIPIRNYKSKIDIMMGITSAFCYDDIYEFVTIGGADKREKDKEYTKLITEVEKLVVIHYVPSTSTLNKILEYKKRERV